MIFLLLLLAFALSSANRIYSIQRALHVPCQKVARLGHTVDHPLKAEPYDQECNVSRHSAPTVQRSQDPALLRARSLQDIYNGPDTVAGLVPVTVQGSDHISLPNIMSLMLQQEKNHEEKTPEGLAERVLRRDNQIKLVHFRTYNYMLPATVVAVRMKEFFDGIAWEATHYWPRIREQSALFTITQGQFQFTMSCLGGTIPWPVLASAARRCSLLASGLFVYTFDAYYMDTGTSMTVAFSLRLLANHLPAPTKPLRPLPKALHQRNTPSDEDSALSRRTPALPNSGTHLSMVKFRAYTAMIPTALMAAKFEDFYNIIALKIETGQFAQWPPAKMRVLLLWDFELTFSCDKINVPWSFIQAFVVDMAEWSSKMFTGFYEATIRGDGSLTGLVFLVRMRLGDKSRGG